MRAGDISDDAVLDLVGAIYDTALDGNRWASVLTRIDDAVGGRSLFGVYDPGSGLSSLLSPRIDPERVQNLLGWAPRNPLLPLGIGRAPGEVFTIGDFITRDEFTRSDFYNEWWQPAGFDAEPLTTNLLVDHNATGILTSHRPSNLPSYDGKARRLFATLAQHLVRAVAFQRHTHQLDITGRAALAGLDELDQGFVLADAQARPVFVNRRARELLDVADSVVLEAGALSAVNSEDGRRLRTLIGSCSLDNPVRIGGEMSLRRPPGRMPLHVQVTPVGSDWTESAVPLASGWRSSAMLLITDPEPNARARLEALRERYGLTRAEAAFALEIVKGDGRKTTAERLGITDGTARSHLSRIFDKTGVSRQAELVRLLLQK
ncbi:helix-turn-helix transcriptional regulator [Bradyrhizobium sp. Cp5.3]|uniref:helix-turn-helix transcriptional regulator n=1 Tax=Bradyrhizobium sp. Cp5.3 TaxID=443598 RepID=UPI0004231F93|nr:transcriptional regulator [Bradyrhizobium sp. Cp5.3]